MGPAFALAEAILARDADTYLHSQRTAAYAELLAAELGLGVPRTEEIATAALLHDVGKIGVPDAILHKREGLTAAEWAVVRSHSAIGASIVESAGLGEIARWIRHLHERFDGHGYPDGLAADRIPFESRLLHAADVLEAMTSERPYRSAVTLEQAAAEIEAVAGSQLDPAVALPLVELVRARGLRIGVMRRERLAAA
jgi:polar amino acid transport system substrate-binding protein